MLSRKMAVKLFVQNSMAINAIRLQYCQQYRLFESVKMIDYKPNSIEHEALKQALKETATNPQLIPIAIGDISYHSGDIQLQRMPHNRRCAAARMSWANRKIVNWGVTVAENTHFEWMCTPISERITIWRKCADILANEDRHKLNAAIMLGQGKTARQAEEDTCRTINDIRYITEIVSENETAETDCQFLMFSSGGFVAAMTPFNWTSWSSNLALCPALMGNCVLWMPSKFSALSCFLIFKALEKANIPEGVISFIPSNPRYLVDNVTKSRRLAGINYAGRLRSYEEIAYSISQQMHRHNCFQNQLGPSDGKNFHFVHESADIEKVAEETILGAFDYSGQRGSSCESLFVPQTLWCDLKDALISQLEDFTVGDVCDLKTKMSAVINRFAYGRIVNQIKHAECSDTCEIIYGGNHCDTHGFFIEPTLIVCNSLDTHIMKKAIAGPILGIYVYEDNKLREIVEEIKKHRKNTLSASIFARDEKVAEHIGDTLKETVANLYINKPCIGSIDGQINEEPCIPTDINADIKCLLHHWLQLGP